MKGFGFFAEFHEGASLSAEALFGPPYADQAWIADYLESGALVVFAPEAVVDPFTPSETLTSGSVLTDGTWLWPSELARLVRVYGLSLPDEFVDHMRRSGFQVPPVTEAVLARIHSDLVADVQPAAAGGASMAPGEGSAD